MICKARWQHTWWCDDIVTVSIVSALSLLSIHDPNMYKSAASSSAAVSPLLALDTAAVRLDLSR